METVLRGLTGIVTGAGTGIGAAISAELAANGLRVVLVGRRETVIKEQAERLIIAGGDALAVVADVRDYAQSEMVVAACLEHYGRLDVFVANAGIVDHDAIPTARPNLWQDVIATNVLGVLYGVRAAVPHMIDRGSGHIVVIASGSGRTTYVGEPAYVASKHAAIAFAGCLRLELAGEGIRVSVIEPGLVDTPLVHSHPFAIARNPGVTPLEPADCARAVRYVLEQPVGCNVFEVALMPTQQTGQLAPARLASRPSLE
jgi:NADP-dependent 3-hydroxy acid dehydrogenase YdfG